MRKRTLLLLALLAVMAALSSNRRAASAPAEFDLIISGGRVVYGTGNPWFKADIAIKDGRGAEIGRVSPSRAGRGRDATELMVSPGSIYVHTRLAGSLLRPP